MHHSSMLPNRKTESEVDRYFRSKYPYRVYDNENFRKEVEKNSIAHGHLHRKIPNEMKPNIKCYCIGDILIGIDLVSGEFHNESENIQKIVPNMMIYLYIED